MNIILSNTDSAPIYEQITRQLRAKIVSGELAAGQALPSMRLLARELRISVITTKRAYEELEREGLIVTQTGRGSFVAQVSGARLREEQLRAVEEHLAQAVRAAKQGGVTAEEESMKNALEIRGLTRKYEGFALDSVNLTLPRGCVMGLVGENGAGKTTLIKTVLDLVRPDSGEIEVLGGRADDAAVRERIGAVLEDGGFLSTMNAAQVDTLLGRAYRAWDGAQFASYLDRFGIDRRKAIKDYSRGMKMKLSIAAALSHGAELLILDEATSGLDPVVRDEVLDLLYDFMQDESHAVLLSSHITSDLDKIADNITFIHHGRVLLSEGRDELIDRHGVLRCTEEQLNALDPDAVRAVRKGAFGCEALVKRDGIPENWPVEPVSVEQIMMFVTKGEEVR